MRRDHKILLLIAVLAAILSGCGGSSRTGGVYDDTVGGDVGSDGSSLDQFQGSGEVAAGGVFKDVHFALDSDRLPPDSMEAVRNNVAILEGSPSMRVEIEGHCDERGSSEYNLALGARRARAVRDAMIELGITSDRMSTVSYGEELPLCKDAMEACYRKNRRAHFVELRR